ncbi:hypothetical protein V6N11_031722 [Hibiscus sabdariffa]|uniref:Uncharacterized protein n=1 Tax=Hibiscus sabdariffa TaxID=183260 RepID=A0ABR2SZ97_9ROSI
MATGESVRTGRFILGFEGVVKEVRNSLLASMEESMLSCYRVGVIAAVGRGQDLVVMDFEDPLVELLNLLEEEAASSC